MTAATISREAIPGAAHITRMLRRLHRLDVNGAHQDAERLTAPAADAATLLPQGRDAAGPAEMQANVQCANV
eukprot:scaffold842_cov357-Prasinococcus_capsulatus_cf.AAC.3